MISIHFLNFSSSLCWNDEPSQYHSQRRFSCLCFKEFPSLQAWAGS
jgi:hypothetical protein